MSGVPREDRTCVRNIYEDVSFDTEDGAGPVRRRRTMMMELAI